MFSVQRVGPMRWRVRRRRGTNRKIVLLTTKLAARCGKSIPRLNLLRSGSARQSWTQRHCISLGAEECQACLS